MRRPPSAPRHPRTRSAHAIRSPRSAHAIRARHPLLATRARHPLPPSAHAIRHPLIRARHPRTPCQLLDLVERAIGKAIAGRDADEVVEAFGGPLT